MLSRYSVPKGILRQYFAAVSACLGVVACASCFGWMTPIFDRLLGPDSEIPMTPEEAPWVVSIIEIPSLISPLPAGVLVNYIGRKPVILITAPLFIISWLVIIIFPSVLVLGLARLIQGFTMGVLFTAAPVYLGEIASSSVRGAITSIFYLTFWLGLLIEYAVGPFLSLPNFTYFTLALNVPFLIFFIFQPESPYYYIMIGEEDKARESLQWFRELSLPELEEELIEIKRNVTASVEDTSIQDVVATPEDRRALTLVLILSSARMLSGIGAILAYATDIFNRTPNLLISPDIATIAVGVMMLVGSCVGTMTSDTLGRRPLLLWSSVGCALCQFCTATYYLVLFKTSLDVARFSWVAPVFILVYTGLCTAGMYPVCSAYISELFETQTRGVASSLSVITVTACAFLATLTYQPVTYNFGLCTTFYFYSVYSILAAVYFYYTAPETKGKSFAQIRIDLCKAQ